MVDLEENDRKLRETYNPDKPLKSLYVRLNECVDYVTVAGEPITEGQVVRISYSLVAETGKFQEYYQTLCAKLEQENTWTLFQVHFIKAHADLRERQQTSQKGEYHTGTANNITEMYVAFSNLAQVTAEDRSVVTNLTTANSTLTEQV